ncbi:hypothetical protein CVT25_014165 [Psilocybe cyanescens]|uniref:Uncharacterized protein n=1 Tax=Psilocybe cyanescens TaxID=93625 RepID=A0A409XUZ3_PSICY|nr:hypothetical protein CVT25_014165 [Psilocybe cyanescens]
MDESGERWIDVKSFLFESMKLEFGITWYIFASSHPRIGPFPRDTRPPAATRPRLSSPLPRSFPFPPPYFVPSPRPPPHSIPHLPFYRASPSPPRLSHAVPPPPPPSSVASLLYYLPNELPLRADRAPPPTGAGSYPPPAFPFFFSLPLSSFCTPFRISNADVSRALTRAHDQAHGSAPAPRPRSLHTRMLAARADELIRGGGACVGIHISIIISIIRAGAASAIAILREQGHIIRHDDARDAHPGQRRMRLLDREPEIEDVACVVVDAREDVQRVTRAFSFVFISCPSSPVSSAPSPEMIATCLRL